MHITKPSTKKYKQITKCRVCGQKELVSFFDLGKQPLANALIKLNPQKEQVFPLSLSWCVHCHLVQLNQTIDPKKLFSTYVWLTGTSLTANQFAKQFYQLVMKRFHKKSGKVVEVGSNDGTFLIPFQKSGYTVLGIDPARNIAGIAKKNGITTQVVFFTQEQAKKIVKRYRFSDIVIARNVLPHVANTVDFAQGLASLVAYDGMVVIEVHDAGVMLDQLHYDAIYHEHLCYFTLHTLSYLLQKVGLFLFDVTKSPISGGSLVVFASKVNRKPTQAVIHIYKQEKEKRTNALTTWKTFAKQATIHKKKFVTLLQKIKNENNMIVGYGASARSSTLLNFCAIDKNVLPLIADKNSLKHGMLAPGTHIPIVSIQDAMQQSPSYVVLLAWNFANEIASYLQSEFGFSGRFIHPLPNNPKITYATKKHH